MRSCDVTENNNWLASVSVVKFDEWCLATWGDLGRPGAACGLWFIISCVYPFTPKISLAILLTVSIHFLWWKFKKIGIRSTYNPLTDIFLFSHPLSAWYCNDIVRRNSVLVTHGSKGLRYKIWWFKFVTPKSSIDDPWSLQSPSSQHKFSYRVWTYFN